MSKIQDHEVMSEFKTADKSVRLIHWCDGMFGIETRLYKIDEFGVRTTIDWQSVGTYDRKVATLLWCAIAAVFEFGSDAPYHKEAFMKGTVMTGRE